MPTTICAGASRSWIGYSASEVSVIWITHWKEAGVRCLPPATSERPVLLWSGWEFGTTRSLTFLASTRDPSIPSAFRAYSLAKVGKIEERIGRPLINAIGRDDLSPYRAVLEILKQLRRNQLVSMAIDVSPHLVGDRMNARFLGRSSRFTANLVRLATQTQTPIIPYFILRDRTDWSRFRVSVQPPILISGNLEEDLQTCVDRLEEVILRNPEQWFIWDSLTHFWDEQ